MFQAEPILWLRTFESPLVTWLLSTVSLMGHTPVYVALIIVLTFGLRLRPGLSVLVALLLAGLATDGLKDGLALPRPDDVDARLTAPGQSPPPALGQGSAETFWAFFDPRVLADFRLRPSDSYGLPSGHVGLATAISLGAALFFRSRGALLFAAGWIPLMAVSRMYLGRHFLADVLAGLVVGGFTLFLAAVLLRPLAGERPSVRGLRPLAAAGMLLLILTPFVSLLNAEHVGRLLGLTLAYALVLAAGAPPEEGTIGQRAARVATAVVLYVVTDRLIGLVWEATGWHHARLGIVAAAMLLAGVTLGGTFAICRRLGWYPPDQEQAGLPTRPAS